MKQLTYFSTFTPNTSIIVKNALNDYLKRVKISRVHQDLIIYSTRSSEQHLQRIPFFNNTFVLISIFNTEPFNHLSQLKWATKETLFIKKIKRFFKNRVTTFRLITAHNHHTQKIDLPLFSRVENLIKRNTNLQVNKHNPQYEIWFIEKREGFGICGIRITKKADYQSTLQKGSIRPEIAYLMNYLADPEPKDIFWDPFTGNGTLALSRHKNFPCQQVIASDIDLPSQQALNNDHVKGHKITWQQQDFLKLEKHSLVNKIVMDPPWGEWQKLEDIDSFYKMLLEKTKTFLTPGGLAVILTSYPLEQALSFYSNDLTLHSKYTLYLGGKEAQLYKLRRKSINDPLKKPSWGQHFLTNTDILKQEVALTKITPKDNLLEIGPGRGHLTKHLLPKINKMTIIELDRLFTPYLIALQQQYPFLQVIWGDATQIKWPKFNKIVANLPYNVSLPLIWKMLDYSFVTAVLVIQKRLAQRLSAKPGQPGYSRLSVTLQRVAQVKFVQIVDRSAFKPAPKVDSAIIKITPRYKPLFMINNPQYFRDVLDFMFFHRMQKVGFVCQKLEVSRHQSNLLGKDLLQKKVCFVNPVEFGKINSLLQQLATNIPRLSNEQKRTAQQKGKI